MITKDGRKIELIAKGARAVGEVRRGMRLVWRHIVAFIFTEDNYGLKTSDDVVIKLTDQE